VLSGRGLCVGPKSSRGDIGPLGVVSWKKKRRIDRTLSNTDSLTWNIFTEIICTYMYLKIQNYEIQKMTVLEVMSLKELRFYVSNYKLNPLLSTEVYD
jgi:hypothetical protein